MRDLQTLRSRLGSIVPRSPRSLCPARAYVDPNSRCGISGVVIQLFTRASWLRVMFGRRPVTRVDFVVGGVQKAGTTALHDFLAQHPHVALLRDQALHFFDKEENFGPSLTGVSSPDYDVLHGNFDPPRNWKIAGEVTADYLYYPRALERIAAYNPGMKLIVSLRNPIDRAFSQWNMRRAKGREALPF